MTNTHVFFHNDESGEELCDWPHAAPPSKGDYVHLHVKNDKSAREIEGDVSSVIHEYYRYGANQTHLARVYLANVECVHSEHVTP